MLPLKCAGCSEALLVPAVGYPAVRCPSTEVVRPLNPCLRATGPCHPSMPAVITSWGHCRTSLSVGEADPRPTAPCPGLGPSGTPHLSTTLGLLLPGQPLQQSRGICLPRSCLSGKGLPMRLWNPRRPVASPKLSLPSGALLDPQELVSGNPAPLWLPAAPTPLSSPWPPACQNAARTPCCGQLGPGAGSGVWGVGSSSSRI